MGDRYAHFLKAHLYPSEIADGYGLLDLASNEDEPHRAYEEDIRSIYAAAIALSRRDIGYASNNHQPSFGEYVKTDEDRYVWGTSVMKMRKAVWDGDIKSVPERAVLLAAIVSFKKDILAVLNADKGNDVDLTMSNNAILIFHKSVENESGAWSTQNLISIAKGRIDKIPDEAMPELEKMVSPDGMDQKLRHMANEAGKASERITLGWGSRIGENNLKENEHSLAQLHNEIARGRTTNVAITQLQGMGM